MVEHRQSASAAPPPLNKTCRTASPRTPYLALFCLTFTSTTCPVTSTTASWYNMLTTLSYFTAVTSQINTLVTRTKNTLQQLRSYFLENDLKLNADKTQCIFVGTRQLLAHIPHNTVIRCAGSNIQPSLTAKNLGLHFDSYLTFDKHINETIKKAMTTLMFINRKKNYFIKETRVTTQQQDKKYSICPQKKTQA